MGANHLAESHSSSELFADNLTGDHHRKPAKWAGAVRIRVNGKWQILISTVGSHVKDTLV